MAYSKDDKEKRLNSIFRSIESGNSLRKALIKNKLPPITFYEWIEADEEKAKQYARATEIRAEEKFDSIEDDYMEEPQRDPETGRIDSAWVQLQRLKIDSKKWELGKLNPKKYGATIGVDHTSKGDKITSISIIDIDGNSI